MAHFLFGPSSNFAMSTAGDQERIVHEQILATDDGAMESCSYLAQWHLSRQSFLSARKYLGHLSFLKRTSPDVWYSLCVCCCAGGDLEEATAALLEAERLSGASEEALSAGVSADPHAILCKGLIAERGGEHEEALGHFESLVKEKAPEEANKSSPEKGSEDNELESLVMTAANMVPREIKWEAWLHMAAVKKDMGDLEEAAAICTHILGDSPAQFMHANVLCLQGVIHEVKKDYQNAEIAYRNCCNLIPTHALGLERLGRLYLRFRETLAAAVQCFQRSLGSSPQNAAIWYLLGRCYMASRQYRDAYLAYNEGVNLEPNEPRIWVSLGVLYYAHGQYKESLGMFARALRLKPDCVEAWYNLGVVYEVNGNQVEADKAYNKAKEHGFSVRLDQVGLTLQPSLA